MARLTAPKIFIRHTDILADHLPRQDIILTCAYCTTKTGFCKPFFGKKTDFVRSNKKEPYARLPFEVISHKSNFACKPGSVLNGHLSLRTVAGTLPGFSPGATRRYVSGKRSPCGVASDRVYSGPVLPRELVGSYPAFPPLPAKCGRSISVALSRQSPAADVISYPAL